VTPVEARYDPETNRLIITCQLHQGVPSKSSGRNLIVCTTSGFAPVEGTNLKMSVNVIKPWS